MSLPTTNVNIGETRIDTDGLLYRFNGATWDLDGTGTPSSTWFPDGLEVGETKMHLASGKTYRWSGSAWVLFNVSDGTIDLVTWDLKINDGAITTAKIANDAVTAAKIATGAVGTSEIATGAVWSDEIATGAVGSDEIATDAVWSDEIAANAVGNSEMADSAIGSAEIIDNSILAWDIAATAPTLVSAERLSNTGLKVTLSEDVDSASATKANDGWFVVFDSNTPMTTYAVSAIARNGIDHNKIELTIADATASAAFWLTVTYATWWNGTVADLTLVPLATNATWVVIPAWA